MPFHSKEPSFACSAYRRSPRFREEASDVARASPLCANGPINRMPSNILTKIDTVAMIIGVRVSFNAKKVAATIRTAAKAHIPIA